MSAGRRFYKYAPGFVVVSGLCRSRSGNRSRADAKGRGDMGPGLAFGRRNGHGALRLTGLPFAAAEIASIHHTPHVR
ncbi:hypothetical protein LCGC14_1239430 [marine sediment metagenome]|uniref:Uncharacterized protein n=1 Tax=marine sediment metagenome TaxID=412755 RepID=A0A0F9LAD5_9ZZZZ